MRVEQQFWYDDMRIRLKLQIDDELLSEVILLYDEIKIK
jgi:Arc/MetJ family transcription regulator